VPTEIIKIESPNSKMPLEGEEENEQNLEEPIDQLKSVDVNCETNKRPDDSSQPLPAKLKSESFDDIVNNGLLNPNVSSINNSEHSNKTRSPVINLVRPTSTPVTRMLHEKKRHSYDSMSASSIQISSIGNNTSSEASDISPPTSTTTTNVNVFKPPNRRMPVAVTPLRQIMSKSIKRAISSQGLSYHRYIDGNISPLDLRTSPVIRRTKSIDEKAIPRTINVCRKETKAVVSNSQQDELNNQNVQNSKQESLQKSTLSRSKSTNTFFETCRTYEAGDTTNRLSSVNEEQTPKTNGILRGTSSFRNYRNTEPDKEQWFTPENFPLRKAQSVAINATKYANENKVDEKRTSTDQPTQSKTGTLWSFVSSVFRLSSTGEKTDHGAVANVDTDNSTGSSLIKRCASFAGILTKKEPIDVENEMNPYKRRRTTTMSEMENCNQVVVDEIRAARGTRRINGRPPIERMRQS
jgi:hypothetical protein